MLSEAAEADLPAPSPAVRRSHVQVSPLQPAFFAGASGKGSVLELHLGIISSLRFYLWEELLKKKYIKTDVVLVQDMFDTLLKPHGSQGDCSRWCHRCFRQSG